MVTDNQKRHLELLQETVDFYAADTSRRAVNEYGTCLYYDDKTGNRCAIGRILDEPVAKALAAEGGLIKTLIDSGKVILDYDTFFLSMLQNLHDNSCYWLRPSGLTKSGEYTVEIIKNYVLENIV